MPAASPARARRTLTGAAARAPAWPGPSAGVASRSAIAWRLSTPSLPRARPSSSFTLPSTKYSCSGTSVIPRSATLRPSCSISRRCSSSLRSRDGLVVLQVALPVGGDVRADQEHLAVRAAGRRPRAGCRRRRAATSPRCRSGRCPPRPAPGCGSRGGPCGCRRSACGRRACPKSRVRACGADRGTAASTTFASTRPRSPSTDHSISSGVPGASWRGSTEASATIFFRIGDQHVLVARPTWPRRPIDGNRLASTPSPGRRAEGRGARTPRSIPAQSISSPTRRRARAALASLAQERPRARRSRAFSKLTRRPSPISNGEYSCAGVVACITLV